MCGVVICFQFSIFALSETAYRKYIGWTKLLWFAFNLVSLHYRRQREPRPQWNAYVVICFQFSIFALSETALLCVNLLSKRLWFAFNLVSLHYRRQLLSRFLTHLIVVICFQFSIFALSETAHWAWKEIRVELWFAFNLVSLHYRRQHYHSFSVLQRCCDLLSI